MSSFNPNEHTIKVQGNREYLPVAARIVWFRRDYPDWSVITEAVQIDTQQGFAMFRCTISNPEGRTITTALKQEDRKGFPDYIEKAETGSVGRALAFMGYGTLGAKDFQEGDRLMDTPLPEPEEAERPKRNQRPAPKAVSAEPVAPSMPAPAPKAVLPAPPEPAAEPPAALAPQEENPVKALCNAFIQQCTRLGVRWLVFHNESDEAADSKLIAHHMRAILGLAETARPSLEQMADALEKLPPYAERMKQERAREAVEYQDPQTEDNSAPVADVGQDYVAPPSVGASATRPSVPSRSPKHALIPINANITAREAYDRMVAVATERGYDMAQEADRVQLLRDMYGDDLPPLTSASDWIAAHNTLVDEPKIRKQKGKTDANPIL